MNRARIRVSRERRFGWVAKPVRQRHHRLGQGVVIYMEAARKYTTSSDETAAADGSGENKGEQADEEGQV